MAVPIIHFFGSRVSWLAPVAAPRVNRKFVREQEEGYRWVRTSNPIWRDWQES